MTILAYYVTYSNVSAFSVVINPPTVSGTFLTCMFNILASINV